MKLTPLGVIMKGLKPETEAEWDDRLVDHREEELIGKFEKDKDPETKWEEEENEDIWSPV